MLELLANIRVVAFTQFLLGPACAQYLADMGADVVKVEDPRGGAWERRWSGGGTFPGGVSAFFLLSHRNVRSVTINLKHVEGVALARRLIKSADVLIENFRPGVMERLGLGYEDIRASNPQLIYASASGYGSQSPYRDLPGQDLLLQALTGLAAVTGSVGQLPTPAGAAIVDQHAASLLALGILGALHSRTVTGQGQRLEVSMIKAALDLQQEGLVYYMNGGMVERPRAPLASSFHEAPYGIYRTADGYIALSLSPIKTIAQALGDPPALEAFQDPEDALPKRNEIYEALAPLLEARENADLLDAFRNHGVWCAPVNDYAAVQADPAVQHADPWLDVHHPEAGQVRLVGHPVEYSSGRPEVRRAPPRLGEHTDEVLRSLGVEPDEIEALRATGAV